MPRDEIQRLFGNHKKNEKMRLMCEDLHYFRMIFSNLSLSESTDENEKKLIGEFLQFLDSPDAESYEKLEKSLQASKSLPTDLSSQLILKKLQEYKSLAKKLEKNAIFEAVWYLAGHESSSNKKLREAVIANLKLSELKDQKSFTEKYENKLKDLKLEEQKERKQKEKEREQKEEKARLAKEEERRKYDEALNRLRAEQQRQQESREQKARLAKEAERRKATAPPRKLKDPSLNAKDEALAEQINKAEKEAKKIPGDEFSSEIERQRRKRAHEAAGIRDNQRAPDEKIAERLNPYRFEAEVRSNMAPSHQTTMSKTEKKTALNAFLNDKTVASRYKNFVYKEKQSLLHQFAHSFAKKERMGQIAFIDNLKTSLAASHDTIAQNKAEILYSALTLLNAQLKNEYSSGARRTDAKSRLESLIDEDLKKLETLYPSLRESTSHTELQRYGTSHPNLGIQALITGKPKESKSKPVNK